MGGSEASPRLERRGASSPGRPFRGETGERSDDERLQTRATLWAASESRLQPATTTSGGGGPAGPPTIGGGCGRGETPPTAEGGRAPGALPTVLLHRLGAEVERQRLPGAVDGPRSKACLQALWEGHQGDPYSVPGPPKAQGLLNAYVAGPTSVGPGSWCACTPGTRTQEGHTTAKAMEPSMAPWPTRGLPSDLKRSSALRPRADESNASGDLFPDSMHT